MTYLDGIHAGLYALGVITPLLAVALLVVAGRLADVPHRVRVAKLRRNVKRSGRQAADYDPPYVYGERYEG